MARFVCPQFSMDRPSNRDEGIASLRWIERLGRISHRSEDRQTVSSWERFIRNVVLEHGDWSIVEHAHAAVTFRVNRGVTHELVRHRLFSYTQESTRFVNGRKSYPHGLEFVLPAMGIGPESLENIRRACASAENEYLDLLDAGVRPQEARAVLPNALASTIAVTGNLRAWRHLLVMRTTKETHPDFLQVTLPLLDEFRQKVPLLFDDIVPMASQAESMQLRR